MPHGKLDELDRIANLELLHDARAVSLNGLRRKRQGLRDRGVGASLDDQLQHVSLAQGEAVERAQVRAFAKVIVDHRLGDPMAQVALARPQRADRLRHCLATVARNRNHLHVARFEQRPKTVPDDRVIVGEQYRDRHVRPPPLTWYSTSTCTPVLRPAFSENRAPTASARSRMISSPQPASRFDLSIRFGSKPMPLSRTDRVARPLVRRIAIST